MRILLGTLLLSQSLLADSVAPRSADNSVEAELASFQVLDGYEVNLFASEADGIANPVAMRWDARGRLWVLTTMAYAQLEPGKLPADRLLILEDVDGDGRADTTNVWADDLNMPTGFALSKDGVYLSEGTSLFFLRDSDGDGKADDKRVVLSGFGVGDTHQNINSITWGPAGDLWFSQGLHNYSRVETPWGIVRGESAGFYRLRVRDLKLEPFCMPAMASENPWGIGFGPWGGLFVKSNAKELAYITPGLIPTDHYLQLTLLSTVAITPGKSMGCEFVETAHMPGLKDHVAIAGYYSNRVTAYPLKEDGSGYAQTEGKELLVSTHPSFRPVEVLVGPEGALYVADWFNPIIGHYQASLRHPDRDKTHGRIWRITAKDQALVEKVELADASSEELLLQLASSERWARYQAKRLLADAETNWILPALETATVVDEHHLFEIAGVFESHDLVDNALVERCLAGADPRLRTYGARMVGRWKDRLEDPLALLERCVSDSHPRVRLEAVVAASHFDSAEAMAVGLRALDAPVDKLISYSLTQCVHALGERWLPAVKSGEIQFDKSRHLIFAVGAYGGDEAETLLTDLVDSAVGSDRRELLLLLAEVGGPEALRLSLELMPNDAQLLEVMVETWKARRVKPSGDSVPLLASAIKSEDAALASVAIELVGHWNVVPYLNEILDTVDDPNTEESVRISSLFAIARLEDEAAIPLLQTIGSEDASRSIRRASANALAIVDLEVASRLASQLLASVESVDESLELLGPYLSRRGGSERLATGLGNVALSDGSASIIAQALSQVGRSDEELLLVVNEAMGVASDHSEYDAGFIAALVNEVRHLGNATNGEAVYRSPVLSCVACHAINGEGGVIGPDITTVGSGLPIELIAESVLWPSRQLKEGYFSISVTTRDGRVYSGYREKEEGGVLWLRDIATQEVVPIPVNQIRERNEVGTLMPSGLANSLSREELRDLLRYLWELRG